MSDINLVSVNCIDEHTCSVTSVALVVHVLESVTNNIHLQQPVIMPRAEALAHIQKLSNIKDIDHQIHKICTVRHAIPRRIHGGWRYFGGDIIKGFYSTTSKCVLEHIVDNTESAAIKHDMIAISNVLHSNQQWGQEILAILKLESIFAVHVLGDI